MNIGGNEIHPVVVCSGQGEKDVQWDVLIRPVARFFFLDKMQLCMYASTSTEY